MYQSFTTTIDCGNLGDREVLVEGDFTSGHPEFFNYSTGVGEPAESPEFDIYNVSFTMWDLMENPGPSGSQQYTNSVATYKKLKARYSPINLFPLLSSEMVKGLEREGIDYCERG